MTVHPDTLWMAVDPVTQEPSLWGVVDPDRLDGQGLSTASRVTAALCEIGRVDLAVTEHWVSAVTINGVQLPDAYSPEDRSLIERTYRLAWDHLLDTLGW